LYRSLFYFVLLFSFSIFPFFFRALCYSFFLSYCSMYESLRTNLPREVMSFAAYPFVPTGEPGRDDRRFCSHGEVQAYLREYASHFNLL
jgi:cation diffusion facilitator CzcD-associated flavoprotein CzcO